MTNRTEDFLREIDDLSDQLMAVSELGFTRYGDNGTLLLSGIVRGCAYQLRDAVDVERKAHGEQGTYDAPEEGHHEGA